MDKAREALSTFLDADISGANTQLCLAALQSDDIPVFQRVNITSSVSDEFRNIVIGFQEKYANDFQKNDLELKEYTPQAKLNEYQLEVLDLDNHDIIKNQIAGLIDLSGLNIFLADEEFTDALRFYAVVVSKNHSEAFTFFRIYTPKKELSRSKMFGIFLKDGQYDSFKESLFLFDENVDCFSIGNQMFIVKKDGFQKIFRFYEMLRKTAKKTLRTIEQYIPIANFQEFSQACEGHLQKIAKLKNISSKPYLKTLTISDLKKVIEKYHLPIKTVGEGTDEKLQFDPANKWAILKLLDDDYLESIMTGSSYEVDSKRTLET